jgi:hypothetical protein
MSKKHFIELADTIRRNPQAFTPEAIQALAAFCAAQSNAFNRTRWLDYVAGTCGPCGGTIKK